MAKITGIYKITNIVNNKVYIGSSHNIVNRWKTHLRGLKNNKHHSKKLQNSFNKHGIDKFTFEVIEECSRELLIEIEQYWIDKLDSYNKGYNIVTKAGVNYGMLGKHHNDDFKKRKSEEMKGNKFSLGLKHSDEYKNYMKLINSGKNNPNYGRKMNPEEIKKRIESVKINGVFKGENNPNFKFKIESESLKKLFLIENKTQKEIAEIYGCSVATITKNLRHYRINKPKSNKYNLSIKDIIMYRTKGLTLNQIGEIYGCTGKKISKYIKTHKNG
jgi:group I intron endonuclease